MLDLGRNESPNQNGIPHHLGILLVAKAKHLSNAQLIHQRVQYTFTLHTHLSTDTLVPMHHKHSRTTGLLRSCLETQCQDV